MTKHITLRMPDDLRSALLDEVQRTGETMTQAVTRLIRLGLPLDRGQASINGHSKPPVAMVATPQANAECPSMMFD